MIALERATSLSITIRPATLRLGGGENSVSYIIIMVKAMLALERAGTDNYHRPITSPLIWEEEKTS